MCPAALHPSRLDLLVFKPLHLPRPSVQSFQLWRPVCLGGSPLPATLRFELALHELAVRSLGAWDHFLLSSSGAGEICLLWDFLPMARRRSRHFPSLPCFSFLTTGKLRLTKEVSRFQTRKLWSNSRGAMLAWEPPLLPSVSLSDVPPALVPVCSLYCQCQGGRETPVSPDLLTCVHFSGCRVLRGAWDTAECTPL